MCETDCLCFLKAISIDWEVNKKYLPEDNSKSFLSFDKKTWICAYNQQESNWTQHIQQKQCKMFMKK